MLNKEGFFKPHHSKLSAFYRLSDTLIIAFVLLAALLIFGVPVDDKYLVAMFLAITVFNVVAESQSLYESFRGATLTQYLTPVGRSWLVTVVILLGLGWMLKISAEFSRLVLGSWMLVVPFLMIAWRLIVRVGLAKYRSYERFTRKVAIIGAEPMSLQLAEVIRDTPSLGLKLLGFYDDRRSSKRRNIDGLSEDLIIGDVQEAVDLAKAGEVDLVYIAMSLKGQERILKIINELTDTSVAVHLVPDFFVFDLLHSRLINLGPIPTISVYESPYFGVNGWAKRAEDIVFSILILLIIAIPMLIIAIGVKLSSPGPVIFKQRRYGMDGSEMRIWKFRSMTTCDDGDTIVQAQKNDVRVTRFGAFLRRHSLDELPQFINVLQGSMSIVGPRPHAVAHNEEYRRLISDYMLRHKVKPGITGWAQVNGWRGETDTVEKMKMRVEHDIYYIRNWSIWFDIMIIVRTVFTAFWGKSVY